VNGSCSPLPVVVHHAGIAGRGQREWQRNGGAHELGGGVNRNDIAKHTGHKVELAEGVHIALDGDLAVHVSVNVVKRDSRPAH